MKLSLILLAHNEEANIKDEIENLYNNIASKVKECEVIICEDGSSDQTKKIINDFESNKNHGIIWRICKSYLMLDGFKDYYLENKKNQNTHEQFNLLN